MKWSRFLSGVVRWTGRVLGTFMTIACLSYLLPLWEDPSFAGFVISSFGTAIFFLVGGELVANAIESASKS